MINRTAIKNKSYLLILFTFSRCVFSGETSDGLANPDTVTSLGLVFERAAVDTITAKLRTFKYHIRASGKVEIGNQVAIITKSTGYIEKIYIENGKYVKRGQLLAVIENDEQRLEVEKARLTKKEHELEFISQIIGKDPTDPEYNKLEENIRITTGLAKAELELKIAEKKYQDTQIRAPISGLIADINKKSGNYYHGNEPLCSIYDVNEIFVTTFVLESEISKLKKGIPAVVNPVADPKVEVEGQVHSINPKVDENGLVMVRIKLNNSDDLVAGMNVSIIIHIPYNNNIVIPKKALVVRSGKQIVFTYDKGLAKWNYVEVGMDNGEEVEILQGIGVNEKVIISNNLQLNHDVAVKIKQ